MKSDKRIDKYELKKFSFPKLLRCVFLFSFIRIRNKKPFNFLDVAILDPDFYVLVVTGECEGKIYL